MADVRACEILPDLGSFHPTTQVRVVDAIGVQRGQVFATHMQVMVSHRKDLDLDCRMPSDAPVGSAARVDAGTVLREQSGSTLARQSETGEGGAMMYEIPRLNLATNCVMVIVPH